MAADIAVAGEAEGVSIFGSFLLDGTELVLGIESLQEVVPFPDRITRMPLAPDHLLGFFNLRGEIVPLVNLKRLLASENPEPAPSQKVAIVESGGARIGLLFDATGEILRVRPEARCRFRYAAPAAHPVLSGALNLDGGSRVLQILDASALLKVENVPQIAAWHGGEGREGAGARRRGRLRIHARKCIAFRSGGARLGFDMGGIREIVRMPALRQSALRSDICLGSIPLRDRTIPVVDFSRFLDGAPASLAAADGADERRVIVMQRDGALFGLLVDGVDNIVSYAEEEVVPIPVLTPGRSALFQGCIPGGQGQNASDLILLDHRELFSNAEIVELTQGHLRLYEPGAKEKAATDGQARASAGREVYISFTLGYAFGLPIRHVHEIVPYPREILRAPGLPSHVLGLINLRGQIVTVVDTRALYGLPEGVGISDQTRIVLLKRADGEKVGFVVDSLESILAAEADDRTELSTLVMQRIEGAFRSDVKEAIQPKDGDGNRRTLLVLDAASLLRRVEGADAAAPMLKLAA